MPSLIHTHDLHIKFWGFFNPLFAKHAATAPSWFIICLSNGFTVRPITFLRAPRSLPMQPNQLSPPLWFLEQKQPRFRAVVDPRLIPANWLAQ